MNYTKFVDREEERTFLKQALDSKDFQLIPVWGRRRTGKTALLLQALGARGVYFLATETADIDNLKRFRDDGARSLNDPTLGSLELNWETMFKYLAPKGIPIIIDEFPYLVSSNPAIPSMFQRIVDLYLKETSTKLILCGSSVRMMESHVLDYKAPLYGRRTGQINLRPLRFEFLREFFPDYSLEDLVRVFGATGGVPLYLMQFDPKKNFWDNIGSSILNINAILYAEADFLLKEEFTHAATYRSILHEIASGKTQMEEIRTSLGLNKSDISPYLNNLESVGFVKREVPVTEDPARSRRGVYRISDNYLNFHFRYVLSAQTMIESKMTKGVLDGIRQDYDTYLGPIFEQVVTEAFLKWSAENGLAWERVGRWWYKEAELDLVALSSSRNEILSAEVKWRRRQATVKDVMALLEKTSEVRWGAPGCKYRHLFVSRGGFTKDCVRLMDEKGILHWALEDIAKIFWGKK